MISLFGNDDGYGEGSDDDHGYDFGNKRVKIEFMRLGVC
jgi:hypothetical protein